VTHTNLDQILKSTTNTLYSQAIKNFLHTYTENADLKTYLEIQKNSSNKVPNDMTEKINKAIKQCKSTGIKYLLLSIQLGFTRLRADQKNLNKRLYLKLIKEFGNVPESCRKTVGRALKLNKSYNYIGDLKAFRMWRQSHLENESDITFNTLSNAISLSGEDSVKSSVTFYRSFQEALKQKDSFRILCGLNNAANDIWKINLKGAVEISEELAYYAGIYAERHHVILIAAGTMMQIAKQNQDYDSFFEAAVITDYYYERLAKKAPSLKKMYQPLIRMARKYALVRKKKTLRREEVSNTKQLREFLKERIGRTNSFIKRHGLSHTTIYRLLKGERPIVLIKTLKVIVKALELKTSFDNPKEINYVLRVLEAENLFERNLEKIRSLSDSEFKPILLRGAFAALTHERTDYFRIFSLSADRERLIDYVKKDYDRIEFINQCFYAEGNFHNGRNELFDMLIKEVRDQTTKHRLIKFCTSLRTNKEIEQLNSFFREYVRISTAKLDFDVETVLEKRFSDPDYERIVLFCRKFNLSELQGYLCTWFFENEERKELIGFF